MMGGLAFSALCLHETIHHTYEIALWPKILRIILFVSFIAQPSCESWEFCKIRESMELIMRL
jgi:hypothetical protein